MLGTLRGNHKVRSTDSVGGDRERRDNQMPSGGYWYESGKKVVTATINEDGKTGKIEVAGITHKADFEVEGFDRRWNFGLQDDYTYDYVFLLKPDGIAFYFDFPSVEAGGR